MYKKILNYCSLFIAVLLMIPGIRLLFFAPVAGFGVIMMSSVFVPYLYRLTKKSGAAFNFWVRAIVFLLGIVFLIAGGAYHQLTQSDNILQRSLAPITSNSTP
jgi:hypothetical protein